MELHYIKQGVFKMNLEHEINIYLQHCEHQKKLSALSIKAYSIDLKQFTTYALCATSDVLSKTTLTGYMQDLHQKYTPRTVKRKLASIRAFLNYLEFEEILNINPIRKIRTKFQEPKQLPKTIPLRSIEQLLAVAHNEELLTSSEYGTFIALRNKAMLEMLFATGIRVSELCSLKTNDINLEDGVIHIFGKGAKERIIQIGNSEVINSLQKYHEANKSNSDFFLSTDCLPAFQNNPFAS